MTYSLVSCLVFGTFGVTSFTLGHKTAGVLFTLASSVWAISAIQQYCV